MSRKIANSAFIHQFSVMRRIGFSPRLMRRLEFYRSQQDKQGRVVTTASDMPFPFTAKRLEP